jgi:hypothetical protein
MPGKHAEVLRSFWLRRLDDQMMLFGGHALLAYEQQTGILAPAPLVRDDSLMFILRKDADTDTIDEIKDAFEDAVGAKVWVDEKRKRTVLTGDAVSVELLEKDYLTRRVDGEEQSEVLEEALEAPAVTGLTVARDSQPVELQAMDPRSFAIAAYVLGENDEIWMERAQFAATLVRERWPEPFDRRQEESFPDVCLDPEESPPPRFRGP